MSYLRGGGLRQTTEVFMGRPHEEHTFYHSMKLDNPTKAIARLVNKIFKYGDIGVKRDLLPTMLDLDISPYFVEKNIAAVRTLLRAFKMAQQRNFIRCITALELAATSDCVDSFYTRTKDHYQHIDAYCTVKAITGDYVEISVVVPFASKQSTMVRELSRQSDCVIDRDGDPDDGEQQVQNMYQFCRNPHTNYILGELKGPCHIVLITSRGRDEYIPIPVWGFGIEDAVRRYQVSDREIRYLEQVHGDIIPDGADNSDKIILLIQLLQERLEDSIRAETAIEVYSLAELLLGYFMISVGASVSNREIVMFDILVDRTTSSLISLRYAESLRQ